MSRYNTGNPLDSNQAKDLDDNAKNLDQYANSEAETFTNRFGVAKKTLAGLERSLAGVLSQVSPEVTLVSDQIDVTVAGFNASLSVYYIDGVRLSYPSDYTYADANTEMITLTQSRPSGSIVIATAIDPSGSGLVASSNQLASLAAAAGSTGLAEGDIYETVDVGARFLVLPIGSPTLVGDITNSGGQVLQLQPLQDGSYSVDHFIDPNDTGDQNQYFSNASSRAASENVFTVTVPNTQIYRLDPNITLTPSATWVIAGATTFDGLPNINPGNVSDLSIFSGKVENRFSSGRSTVKFMGDGSKTYQKVSGRNGQEGCLSVASVDGTAAISGVVATSMNDSAVSTQGGIGIASKGVNDQKGVPQSLWCHYFEALHLDDDVQGNTVGYENGIANGGTTCPIIDPYTVRDQGLRQMIASTTSVGFGNYIGPVSLAFNINRASAGAYFEKGMNWMPNSVNAGPFLNEAYCHPNNYGASWYSAEGEMFAFTKGVSSGGNNEYRVSVFDNNLGDRRDYVFQNGAFFCGTATNTADIGSANLRVKSLYLVNSPDVSSDETMKTEQANLSDDELAAAKEIARLPKLFKWIDEVEKKGDAAYLHCSPMAQSVWAALEDNNLDPAKYGFISNENNAWSIKPQELLWLICAAQQNQLDSIEARLNEAGL